MKHFDVDDPTLTAFALGELSGAERAQVAAAVAADAALQAAVEEIRATAAQLSSAFEAEPLPETTPLPLVLPEHRPPIRLVTTLRRQQRRPAFRRFPYVLVAGFAAAACIAVMFHFEDPTRSSSRTPVAKHPAPAAGEGPLLADAPGAAADGLIELRFDAHDNKAAVSPVAPAIIADDDHRPPALERPILAEAAPPMVAGPDLALVRPDDYAAARDDSTPGPELPAAIVAADAATPRSADEVAEALAPAQTILARPLEITAVQPLRNPLDAVSDEPVWTHDSSLQMSSAAGNFYDNVVVLSEFTVSSQRETGYSALMLSGHRSANSRDERGVAPGLRRSRFGSGYFSGAEFTDGVEVRRVGSGFAVGRVGAGYSTAGGGSSRPVLAIDAPVPREHYAPIRERGFVAVAGNPRSTFSAHVETASYTNVRRFLMLGQKPPPHAVKIEELVNYFRYDYAPPAPNAEAPVAAALEVASAPWAPQHRLVRIGLRAREVPARERPPAHLVFLVDVSASMDFPNKLPLVKQSLRMLLDQLQPSDRVAIVVYAADAGLALPSMEVSRKPEILQALETLKPDGETDGALGIHLAYEIAQANFIHGGINRVILATDGDFNLGPANEAELAALIEDKARSGVALTTLGFGLGSMRDNMLEQLAARGRGACAYIDSAAEARRVLVEQAGGALVTVAKDVKVQVEFNPARVQAYRLIGYESRLLAPEEFNLDAVETGEIGAGHAVTALYEVIPVGVEWRPASASDPLKYQQPAAAANGRPTAAGALRHQYAHELLTVRVRYKLPTVAAGRSVDFPLVDRDVSFADASADFKFAAAVASFGMMLRQSPHAGSATFDQVIGWAQSGLGADASSYRSDFVSLVRRAQAVMQ